MRKTLGVASLLVLLALVIAIRFGVETVVEPEGALPRDYDLMIGLWFVASLGVKFSQVHGYRWPSINGLALGFYVGMVLMGRVLPDRGGVYEVHLLVDVLSYIFLLGWPLVDLVDIWLIRKEPD